MMMTMMTIQAYPGGTDLKVGGTCQARSAGNFFFVVPSTF